MHIILYILIISCVSDAYASRSVNKDFNRAHSPDETPYTLHHINHRHLATKIDSADDYDDYSGMLPGVHAPVQITAKTKTKKAAKTPDKTWWVLEERSTEDPKLYYRSEAHIKEMSEKIIDNEIKRERMRRNDAYAWHSANRTPSSNGGLYKLRHRTVDATNDYDDYSDMLPGIPRLRQRTAKTKTKKSIKNSFKIHQPKEDPKLYYQSEAYLKVIPENSRDDEVSTKDYEEATPTPKPKRKRMKQLLRDDASRSGSKDFDRARSPYELPYELPDINYLPLAIKDDPTNDDYSEMLPGKRAPRLRAARTKTKKTTRASLKTHQPKEDPKLYYQSEAYLKENSEDSIDNEVSHIYPGREVIWAHNKHQSRSVNKYFNRNPSSNEVSYRLPDINHRSLAIKDDSTYDDYSEMLPGKRAPRLRAARTKTKKTTRASLKTHQPKEDPKLYYQSEAYLKENSEDSTDDEVSQNYPGMVAIWAQENARPTPNTKHASHSVNKDFNRIRSPKEVSHKSRNKNHKFLATSVDSTNDYDDYSNLLPGMRTPEQDTAEKETTKSPIKTPYHFETHRREISENSTSDEVASADATDEEEDEEEEEATSTPKPKLKSMKQMPRNGSQKLCIKCPSDRTIITAPGSDEVRMSHPDLLTCTGEKTPKGIRFVHLFGTKIGSLLTDGSHVVMGRIMHNNKTMQLCKLLVHVIVQNCSVPKHLKMHCNLSYDVCHFSCRNDYQDVSHMEPLKCNQKDMMWNGTLPTCTVRRACVPLPPPKYGHISCKGDTDGTLSKEGSKCRLRCPTGWGWSPRNVAICLNGSWTNTLECRPRWSKIKSVRKKINFQYE